MLKKAGFSAALFCLIFAVSASVIGCRLVSNADDSLFSGTTSEGEKFTASTMDIDIANIGDVCTISGQATRLERYKSGNALLFIEQNSGEIQVYLPAELEIDLLAVSVGENYTISGMLQEYAGERELVPSSASDIVQADGYSFEEVTVVSVIDGDTIKVAFPDGQVSKVRIIGVDCPETEKTGQTGEFYAGEATAYIRSILQNQTVYLEKDNSETDKYDRLLRYIWLEIPEVIDSESIVQWNVSALLLAQGYASFIIVGNDNKYADAFSALEDQAKTQNSGMWTQNLQTELRVLYAD